MGPANRSSTRTHVRLAYQSSVLQAPFSADPRTTHTPLSLKPFLAIVGPLCSWSPQRASPPSRALKSQKPCRGLRELTFPRVQKKKIVIFYGSQTGTAEDYATRIAKEAKQRYGLSSLVCDLEE